MGDGKSNDIFPTLNSFCFCISLRTGSLCIAWYYLIAGLMGIIPMLPKQYDFITSISTTGNTARNKCNRSQPEILCFLVTLANGYAFTAFYSLNTEYSGEMITRLLIVEYYFLLLLMVISCIFLIDGIRKKIPKEVRPFIFYGCIFFIHEIFVILLLLFTPLRHDAETFLTPISTVVATALTNPWLKAFDLVLAAYLLLTVHSYHKELKREVGQNNSGAIV